MTECNNVRNTQVSETLPAHNNNKELWGIIRHLIGQQIFKVSTLFMRGQIKRYVWAFPAGTIMSAIADGQTERKTEKRRVHLQGLVSSTNGWTDTARDHR